MISEDGSSRADELRGEEEAKIQAVSSGVSPGGRPEDLQRQLHELQVHLVEVEIQNAEMRRDRAALEKAVAKNVDFLHVAPVAAYAGLRCLVADRRRIARELLQSYLVARGCAEVVTVADGIETLRLLEESRFDVLITFATLDGLDGIAVVGALKKLRVPTQAIVLADRASGQIELLRALRAGARGYLALDDGFEKLGAALDALIHRNLYVSPSALIDHDLVSMILEAQNLPPAPFEWLTIREREVLELIRSGLTTARIADRLSLSPHTIEGHRASLMNKTRSHNIGDLMVWLRAAESHEPHDSVDRIVDMAGASYRDKYENAEDSDQTA